MRLSMPQRMYPSDYYGECVTEQVTEPSVIPIWVPVLIGISIIAITLVALYAISKSSKS